MLGNVAIIGLLAVIYMLARPRVFYLDIIFIIIVVQLLLEVGGLIIGAPWEC